jgi:hypothetical protein
VLSSQQSQISASVPFGMAVPIFGSFTFNSLVLQSTVSAKNKKKYGETVS